MPCRSLCRLYIHLAFTYSIGPSSVVWRKLGPAPPFPPMRVHKVYWSWALSLVCEVAIGHWLMNSQTYSRMSSKRVHHEDIKIIVGLIATSITLVLIRNLQSFVTLSTTINYQVWTGVGIVLSIYNNIRYLERGYTILNTSRVWVFDGVFAFVIIRVHIPFKNPHTHA